MTMSIGIDRNANTQRMTAAEQVQPDTYQIVADTSSAGFTATLTDWADGGLHEVVATIIAGGNTLTISGNNGNFETTLTGIGTSLILQTRADGTWFVAGATGVLSASPTFDGADSFQTVAADLNLDSGAGVDTPDTAFLAGVMGNVLGENLTETGNYVGGVIGAYNVTGTNASNYPKAGVIGDVGDQTTTANAAVLAVLDGDGGLTGAEAAFGVDYLNSTVGSGFDWMFSGAKAAHDGYLAAVPRKGFALVALNAGGLPVGLYFGVATDDAGIVAQVGADNTIADGSLYISILDNAGKLFQKQNDVWVDLQA